MSRMFLAPLSHQRRPRPRLLAYSVVVSVVVLFQAPPPPLPPSPPPPPPSFGAKATARSEK